MPELPEVETIARGLAPQLEGRAILDVTILNESSVEGRRKVLADCVSSCGITRVYRRGKLLMMDLFPVGIRLIETSREWVPVYPEGEPPSDNSPLCERLHSIIPVNLAFHLKMTGQLFVYPHDKQPDKNTRIIFDLSDSNRLFFNDTRKFGYCRALEKEDFASWPFWQKLGPEPLLISEDGFVQLFRGRRTRIKAALLDQTVIAGIGNIYADESLFRARIRPDALCNAIPESKLRTLHTVIQEVLQQAIRECGSSIRDYRDAHGDAGAFQNNFLVYGKAGEKCTECGKTLSTAKVAGRTTVFCAKCQR